MKLSNVEKKFQRGLLTWFATNKRDFPWRTESDPYRILVAEKLLQQTTTGHVLKVYDRFFQRFPDLAALNRARTKTIESVIKPLGFQRQRSRQLKAIAKTTLTEYDGKVPSDPELLKTLSGVGEYVANAVACFCFGQDLPVMDVNVRRVIQRTFLTNETKLTNKVVSRQVNRLIPRGKGRDFGWALIDFGGLVCRRKPRHTLCFFTDYCQYIQLTESEREQLPPFD